MKIKMFENLSKQEVIDRLEAECIAIENKPYLRPFDNDELSNVKKQYADKSKESAMIQDEINKLTHPLKEEKKIIDLESKSIMQSIKDGGVFESGKVYIIPDYENKIMIEYSSEGTIVGTRQMTVKERQLHINSHLSFKVQSNG